MAQHRPRHSATNRPSGNSRRRNGARAAIRRLDAFVAAVYLPHVRLRKRSWRVDERIARQRLSGAGLPAGGGPERQLLSDSGQRKKGHEINGADRQKTEKKTFPVCLSDVDER